MSLAASNAVSRSRHGDRWAAAAAPAKVVTVSARSQFGPLNDQMQQSI
jgi:hypothetical protein